MESRIDTTFQTMQRDLFASGVAARIGMNAFGLWSAIKNHADWETGECWPGMRRLSELTGLSTGTISNCVKTLVEARLLRIVQQGSRTHATHYVARERLDIRVGNRVLCTVVMDYVPRHMRTRLASIEQALVENKPGTDAFTLCEIIPGDGFQWDDESKVLRAAISVSDLPSLEDEAAAADQLLPLHEQGASGVDNFDR